MRSCAYHTCKHPCVYARTFVNACIVRVKQPFMVIQPQVPCSSAALSLICTEINDHELVFRWPVWKQAFVCFGGCKHDNGSQ